MVPRHAVAPRRVAVAQGSDVTDLQELRHANLLRLINEAGGVKKLAELSGRSHSQISQLKNRSEYAEGKTRAIGSRLARHLERVCGKPPGWLDVPGTPPGSGDAAGLSHEALEIARRLDGIADPDHRRIALAMCRLAAFCPAPDLVLRDGAAAKSSLATVVLRARPAPTPQR